MALINNNDVSVLLEYVLNFPTLGETDRIASLNSTTKLAERTAQKPPSRIQNLIEEAELN